MRFAPMLLLAGCTPLAALLDQPLAQLARWETASPAAIAAEPVACPAGHAACARLHQRHAEACMALAMGSRAPGAACPGTAAHLACAAAGYAAARALEPHPMLAQGEAQARLCLAAFLPSQAAEEEAARALAASTTPLNAARAALIAGRAGTRAQRCAATLAGLRAAPPASREAADLSRRRASLPACGAMP